MANSLLESLQAKEYQEARGALREESDERALLAGATPLLVGLLGGFKGNSGEIASQALLKEDQRMLGREKSLFDIMQKRKTASSGKGFRVEKVRLDDGRLATYDPNTREVQTFQGEKIDDPRFYRLDPDDLADRKSAVLGAGAKFEESPVTARGGRQVSRRVRDVGMKALDKFKSETKDLQKGLDSMTQADALINSKGILGQKMAIMSLVKSLEGARMSDQDRSFYTSNVSSIQSILERAEEEKNAKVRKRLVADAKEVISRLKRLNKGLIQDRAMEKATSLSTDKNEREYLYEVFTPIIKSKVKISNPRKKASGNRKFSNLSDEEIEARIQKLRGK